MQKEIKFFFKEKYVGYNVEARMYNYVNIFWWLSFGAICLNAEVLPITTRRFGWRVQFQHWALPTPYSCQNYCISALACVTLNSILPRKKKKVGSYTNSVQFIIDQIDPMAGFFFLVCFFFLVFLGNKDFRPCLSIRLISKKAGGRYTASKNPCHSSWFILNVYVPYLNK